MIVDKEDDELSEISLVKDYPHAEEEEKIINYLPDWLCDKDLKHSQTETLSVKEDEFWMGLIEKYLKPIDKSDDEKVYRHLHLKSVRVTTSKQFSNRML